MITFIPMHCISVVLPRARASPSLFSLLQEGNGTPGSREEEKSKGIGEMAGSMMSMFSSDPEPKKESPFASFGMGLPMGLGPMALLVS